MDHKTISDTEVKRWIAVFEILLTLIQVMVMQNMEHLFTKEQIDNKLDDAIETIWPYVTLNKR